MKRKKVVEHQLEKQHELLRKDTSEQMTEVSEKGRVTQEEGEWKTVEKKKRKEEYRLYVRGQGRQRIHAQVIRRKIDEVIQKDKLKVSSLKWAKNENWSVVIVMTCALELVQLADALNAIDHPFNRPPIQEFPHPNL